MLGIRCLTVTEAKIKKCWVCGRTDFETWDELADHKLNTKDTPHKRDKSGKLWAKKYKHREAINKLKKIGKKEQEPRQALTPEQLEAKRDSKYELSGQTKLVPIRCPRCKKGDRDFLPVEFVNSPTALKIDGCFVILCKECK